MSEREQKKLFQEAFKLMMEEKFGRSVNIGDKSVAALYSPPKISELPSAILERIFVHLTNPSDYGLSTKAKQNYSEIRKRKRKYEYNSSRNEMTKDLWKLPCVCRSFYAYFDSLSAIELSYYPQPEIGLRIMPKSLKRSMRYNILETEQKYIAYIYGEMSCKNTAICGTKEELPSLLYPGTIKSMLCVQGFVLDDELIEMLKLIDTSQVEEVYFNDIKGVDLEQYSINFVLSLFPNAMKIRFLGDDYFQSLSNVSVDVDDMEKADKKDIPYGTLVSMYHDIDATSKSHKKFRRDKNILLREVQKLLKTDKNDKNAEEQNKSLRQLIRTLNNPPKNVIEIEKLQKQLAELQAQTTSLKSREEMNEEWW